MAACVLVVAAWWFTLAPTRIGGPLTPVLVRGSSMLPTYHTGDLVVAYRASRLEPGQVIAFREPEGNVVIHRLVAVDGERLVTKGDNLGVTDRWPTTTGDVLGTARFVVPGLGRVLSVLARPVVLAALAGLLAFLVVAWPTRERPDPRGPVAGSTLTTLLLIAVLPTIGVAAGMAVTTDQLSAHQLAGPFPTYLVTPGGGGGAGGGGGGCTGQGNEPGC